jgi:hypothetical protein
MKRTILLKIMDLAHLEEEEKMKQKDREEDINEKKRKEEAKQYYLKIPLLEQ